MRTISFATTQMNLINCVEYLNTIEGKHYLYVLPDSSRREKQIMNLVNNGSYSQIFDKVHCCHKTGKRLLDSVILAIFLFRIRVLSLFCDYGIVITGNYRNYGARLMFQIQEQKNNNCFFVVCDDGLATKVIESERLIEYKTGKPYVFYPNRIERYLSRINKTKIIPDKIVYFTSYDISAYNQDTIIKNNYNYLKQHLEGFNIDYNLFNTSAMVIGQPLYSKDYILPVKYKEKLQKYADTVEGKIVYYAHPEENENDWKKLMVSERYIYVNNFIPFEIVAAMLPSGCRIASFFSSVLINLSEMNKDLRPECIVFRKEDFSAKANYSSIVSCYDSYRSMNVRFYEFS